MTLRSARAGRRAARRLLALGVTAAAVAAAGGCGSSGGSTTTDSAAAPATSAASTATTPPESTATTPPTTATTPPTTATTPPRHHLTAAMKGGRVAFMANCAGCHTLADANATGTGGPNLDTITPEKKAIENQVKNGGGAMPPFGRQLSARQIAGIAAYVSTVGGG
jgi:mono/diheme cytochrome c family protein